MIDQPRSPIEALSDDPIVLKEIIGQLSGEVAHLKHIIHQLRRHQFGVRSEQIPEEQLIFGFYGRLETDREKAAREKEAQPVPPREKKKGHGRRVIPPELPRVVVLHDVPEDEKTCSDCKEKLREFAREVSEQLEYHPGELHVLQHVRPKYACPNKCPGHIVVAPPATSPIERGMAGPGLLAHTLDAKYNYHLPLYRIQTMLRNRGIELTRSTLCGWVGQCVGLVRPIYAAVVRDILGSKVLHTDDTPVRVLEPGQGKARLARLWAYVGDRQHYQVAYQFTLTREQQWAKEFLGDWKGYLQADAYPGYGQLYTGGTIVEVGCWAHVRRKFFDAQETNKTRALLALAWIGRLYGVEKEARTLSSIERRALRQARSKPILEEIKAWLDGEIDRVPPRSPIAQAMQYARGQWGALVRYLEDGDLDIDNNECERLIRGCCVGRKNYLFFGSEGGGEWGAVIYTLVESAKLNGHDPFAYFKDVLVRVGAHPMRRIDELMPRLWKPPPSSS